MLYRLRNKISHLEEFISDLQSKGQIVGLSIAIVYDDNIIYEKGFGKSNLGLDKSMNADTIISIQSITKSFAATSIMQLVEKGLISLNDPLVKYIPYFETSDKLQSQRITVRQLLSHTAGFPNDVYIANAICPNIVQYNGLSDLYEKHVEFSKATDKIKSYEDITRYFKNVNLEYLPGSSWKYCTDAYALVGDLFEKVSGVSWDLYVEKEIIQKIGMKRTTLNPSRVKEDTNSSRYYIKKDDTIIEAPIPENPIAAPIGFIYSTARDMAKYLAAHMEYGYSPILTSRSIATMQIPVASIGNNTHKSLNWLESIGYGLGWFIGNFKDFKIVGHSGSYTGVRAYVAMVPEKKLGVVALANFDNTTPETICKQAIDIMLED